MRRQLPSLGANAAHVVLMTACDESHPTAEIVAITAMTDQADALCRDLLTGITSDLAQPDGQEKFHEPAATMLLQLDREALVAVVLTLAMDLAIERARSAVAGEP